MVLRLVCVIIFFFFIFKSGVLMERFLFLFKLKIGVCWFGIMILFVLIFKFFIYFDRICWEISFVIYVELEMVNLLIVVFWRVVICVLRVFVVR